MIAKNEILIISKILAIKYVPYRNEFENLLVQAYVLWDQQLNPILLKARLLLDFWNPWMFDT